MISLYDYTLSGNCYKVRLLLHWLGLEYTRIPVDFHPGREQRSARFKASINPQGQLPVLRDADLLLPDSRAILIHLASQYDPGGQWYPQDARARGSIGLWLALADDITHSASAARLHLAFGYPADLPACQQLAHAAFRRLDDQLAENQHREQAWLVGATPTIADIACFPYTALASEAGIDLIAYPALRRWIDDLRHWPGFITMPGILHPAP